MTGKHVFGRVKTVQVGEQKAYRVANAAIGIGGALQDFIRYGYLGAVISACNPQAKNICAQFYDEETADNAETEFNNMFVKKDLPDDIPDYNIPDEEKKDSKIWIIKLLVLAGMAKSNGESRRLIKGGGVSIDGEKITDDNYEMGLPFESILKVGKRRFVRIIG